MKHTGDATSQLFLLRVSAENDDLRVVVVAGRNESRAVFRTLQAATTYIAQSLKKDMCSVIEIEQ